MAHAATVQRNEDETVLFVETLPALIERIETAMRPLHRGSYGPDHDRVRSLYANLVRTSTGDSLALARRAVLYEMLYVTMHPCGVEKPHD